MVLETGFFTEICRKFKFFIGVFRHRNACHSIVVEFCQHAVYFHFLAALDQLNVYGRAGHQRSTSCTVVYPATGVLGAGTLGRANKVIRLSNVRDYICRNAIVQICIMHAHIVRDMLAQIIDSDIHQFRSIQCASSIFR